MTDLQMLGNSFFANLAWYRRTKDLVSLFDPKVPILKKSSKDYGPAVLESNLYQKTR